jgi:hypothetical protein
MSAILPKATGWCGGAIGRMPTSLVSFNYVVGEREQVAAGKRRLARSADKGGDSAQYRPKSNGEPR